MALEGNSFTEQGSSACDYQKQCQVNARCRQGRVPSGKTGCRCPMPRTSCCDAPRGAVVKDSRLHCIPKRRSEKNLTLASVVRWLLRLYIFLCFLLSPSMGQGRKEPCPNIDIRNKVSSFEPWLNCTVIEGALQIVLMTTKETTKDSFNNISFPYLTEITDFLLVHQINHLRSLSNMFPSLAVIRGNKLYMNNALTIYRNDHLQDLGLGKLTSILQGSVWIEGNPQLCYLQTINWNQIIANEAHAQNLFFDENMDSENCPSQSSCPSHCPVDHHNTSMHHCWNANLCQRVCICESNVACYTNSSECCHEECVGGCTGPGPTQCLACRNWLSTDGMTCVKECSADSYQYMRRCVSYDECMNMNSPLPLSQGQNKKETYVPVSVRTPYTCEISCPPGYQKKCKDGKRFCRKCEGDCRKPMECLNGVGIMNLGMAKHFIYDRGCTHIKGQLIINVLGDEETQAKLKFYLQNVEIVDHYVKIYRSDITSLDILSNLKTIKGKELCCGSDSRNALVVLNNRNLRDLWNVSAPRPTIEKGGLFFHNNPKLCVKKIKNLYDNVGIRNVSWETLLLRDISNFTNGDKAQCAEQTITLEPPKTKGQRSVFLRWNNVGRHMRDYRNLLSYSIVYRKLGESEPTPKVDDYFEPKTDADNNWVVIDEPAPNDETGKAAEQLDVMVGNLEAYTLYAAFVQTSMLPASFDDGGISNMVRFRTIESTPSRPEKIMAHTKSSSQLYVKWWSPLFPNGLIKYYKVTYTEQEDNLEPINNRVKEEGKCTKSISIPITVVEKNEMLLEEQRFDEPVTSLKERQQLHENKKNFEDATLEYVFISGRNSDQCDVYGPDNDDQCEVTCIKKKTRRYNHHRSLRSIYSETSSIISDNALESRDGETTSFRGTRYFTSTLPPMAEQEEEIVRDGKTDVTLEGLRHFTPYLIEVEACQEKKNDSHHSPCSDAVKITGRTGPLDTADIVRNLAVSVNETGKSVTVMWDEPLEVNGKILLYEVNCTREDTEGHLEVHVKCVLPKAFDGRQSYKLNKQLEAGVYHMHVRAYSLNGPGEYRHYKFYIEADKMKAWVIAAIVLVVTAGLGCVFLLLWKYMKLKGSPVLSSANPDYFLYTPDAWEVDRNRVMWGEKLGSGCFGDVFEGLLLKNDNTEENVPCAIKTVADTADYARVFEFLNEASLMKKLVSHHVIQLLGVVSKDRPVMVLMELMQMGDLRKWLRANRPDEPDATPPTVTLICKMALEIADGMAYLADTKTVHRDLAARNCMLTADLTVKVGDLGLARDIYTTDYYRKRDRGLLPVRWMPPESLKDGVFQSSSDVWSYGVVLWEMVTLAAQPYGGLSQEQVWEYVTHGNIMDKPENCPDELYEVMKQCWQKRPNMRPSFNDLVDRFLPYATQDFKQNAYYYNKESIVPEDDGENGVVTPLTIADSSYLAHAQHHPKKGSMRRKSSAASLSDSHHHHMFQQQLNSKRNSLERGDRLPMQRKSSAASLQHQPLQRMHSGDRMKKISSASLLNGHVARAPIC